MMYHVDVRSPRSPGGTKDIHYVSVAFIVGNLKGGIPVTSPRLDIGATIEQEFHHGGFSRFRSVHKGGIPAIIPRLDIGATIEEEFHHSGLSAYRSPHKGGIPVTSPRLDIGATIEEEFHHGCLSS